ncbi:MAG: mechanosensitive ion channel family protein, partial [Bacteroidota bacterium]|nr:mechanosensitive ion channel family protein [Bacteroidota bacterium]
VAREIQKKVEGAITDFEPLMRFSEFADSNINFYVILRVKDPVAKYEVKHQFIKALKKRFDQEQIEISWPVTKVYLHNKS